MNERQRRYVQARKEGLSKTEAAAAAGYSASSAAALRSAAARLEQSAEVRRALRPAKPAKPKRRARAPAEDESVPGFESLAEATLRKIVLGAHPPYVMVQASAALSRIEAERRKAAQAALPPPTPLVVFLEPGMGTRAPTKEEALGIVAQLGEADWRWVVEERSKPRQRVVSVRNRRKKESEP